MQVHGPHWIQNKLSLNGPIYPVEIIRVEGNYVTFSNGDKVWGFWNHSAEDLQNMFLYVHEHPFSKVDYRERGSVLAVGDSFRQRLYSLAEGPTKECRIGTTRPGGFSISGTGLDSPAIMEITNDADEATDGNAETNEETDE